MAAAEATAVRSTFALDSVYISAVGDLNLRLVAVDASSGGIYSIKMEWLSHQDGIVRGQVPNFVHRGGGLSKAARSDIYLAYCEVWDKPLPMGTGYLRSPCSEPSQFCPRSPEPDSVFLSAVGNLNLCLVAFDASGGGVYSIRMELLNHLNGMVIPS